MNRIEFLRNEALNRDFCRDEFFYLFYKKYEKSEKPDYSKYAEAFEYAFSKYTPNISDDELIVGKTGNCMSDEEKSQWEAVCKPNMLEILKKTGITQDSHMAIDYDLLLSEGINGIIKKIDVCAENAGETQKKFYELCKACLKSVILHSENYSQKALELSKNAETSKRREELLRISEICKKVPANPADSFYEAVQSVHFVTYCLSLNPFRYNFQQFQLGHPDRYLYSYYKSDIQSGALTPEFAQLLLDCLGIQINNRVPSGLSSGYMVGGKDADARFVQNELTGMCMQVVDDIRLVYPAVGLCIADGMDDKYLADACKILLNGRSHPAIFNDDVISDGLRRYGVDEKNVHNYIHSTCVEITPVAASNVWVASPYTNMVQIFLDCMKREYADFDELIAAIYANLDMEIQKNFETEKHNRMIRAENSINPLLSCFVDNCLEKGIDIECGGAVYNWVMPSFVGMANLVDSLYVVKKIVFENKEMTLYEFGKILEADFEGYEQFRFRILNSFPKYGNDIDDVDALFGMIAGHIADECQKYDGMHSNANLIPSVFCWVMHERFGRNTGASPDGRKSGFPLGDGSGPCQGRESNGPTASVISSTKWNHASFIGGVAVNMKFAKSSLGEDSASTLKSLIKTYLSRGGFEIQINITDKATLEDAVKNPENYKDLVVRIGGYSDYFVRLSPQMQEEVILRTEHTI